MSASVATEKKPRTGLKQRAVNVLVVALLVATEKKPRTGLKRFDSTGATPDLGESQPRRNPKRD